MHGIILAGGDGKRFAATGCCKALLRINGKYLIGYALDNLALLRVSDVIIVVGRYENKIRRALGGSYRGIPLRYVRQPEQKGLADALRCAVPALGNGPAVLQLCDEILLSFSPEAAERIAEADFLCGYTLPREPEEICENYALDCCGETLLHTEEKPLSPRGGKKGTGFCVFRRECLASVLDAPAEKTGVSDLCDLLNELLRRGKKGLAVRIAEEEINVNDVSKYEYAKRRLG